MKKTIVVYYSRKGSNKYLAQKIAKSLGCDIEEIRPRLNVFLLYLMNMHLGIKPLKYEINEYEKVILCGPIWMGKFIPPLRSFVKKYDSKISKLIFVTCCGSTDAQKMISLVMVWFSMKLRVCSIVNAFFVRPFQLALFYPMVKKKIRMLL